MATSAEAEPFISQPEKPTVIPVTDSNPVTTSNEQSEQLSGRIQNPTQSGTGNPAALGLSGFALTTFILSVFNAGDYLISHKLEPVVLPVALFYGGLAQLLAGMWEFKVGNTFGATAFTSYGAFWMSFAGYVHIIVPQIKEVGHVKKATGLFLLAWLIFTLIMNVASFKISKFLLALFTCLSVTFLFLTIGNLANISIIVNIG